MEGERRTISLARCLSFDGDEGRRGSGGLGEVLLAAARMLSGPWQAV